MRTHEIRPGTSQLRGYTNAIAAAIDFATNGYYYNTVRQAD